MQLKELQDRCSQGEVVPCEAINGYPVEDFVAKHPQLFVNLTCQDDVDKAGVFWIFDNKVRQNNEYNPTSH